MHPTGGVGEEARGTSCVPLEERGKEPGDLVCPAGGAREGAGEGGAHVSHFPFRNSPEA